MLSDDMHPHNDQNDFKYEDIELSPQIRQWIVLVIVVCSVLFALVILVVLSMERAEERARRKMQ